MTQGPGWRWVFFVNPLICLGVVLGTFLLIESDRRSARLAHFDVVGAVLSTAGMLLLVYAIVRAPIIGWGAPSTLTELAGAFILLALFLVNEVRTENPLLPLSIFKIKGLGAADATQLIAIRRFSGHILLSHLVHARRVEIFTTANRSGLPSGDSRRDHCRWDFLSAVSPDRDASHPRRRGSLRRRRCLLPRPCASPRFLPGRSPARPHCDGARPRRGVHWCHDCRKRWGSSRQGWPGGRTTQRFTTARWCTRDCHLHGYRHVSHATVGGNPHAARRGSRCWIPSRAACRGRILDRRRSHRSASYQYARRGASGRRGDAATRVGND